MEHHPIKAAAREPIKQGDTYQDFRTLRSKVSFEHTNATSAFPSTGGKRTSRHFAHTQKFSRFDAVLQTVV